MYEQWKNEVLSNAGLSADSELSEIEHVVQSQQMADISEHLSGILDPSINHVSSMCDVDGNYNAPPVYKVWIFALLLAPQVAQSIDERRSKTGQEL